MFGLFDHPLLILVFTFGASLLAHAYTFGCVLVDGNLFDDLVLLQTATLTLVAGYVTQGSRSVLLILTIALAISFFLVADIDRPGWGVIRVHPQNLESLASS